MSMESYARGFCKKAESYGVDPIALVKFAEGEGSGNIGGSLLDGLKHWFSNWRNSKFVDNLKSNMLEQSKERARLIARSLSGRNGTIQLLSGNESAV